MTVLSQLLLRMRTLPPPIYGVVHAVHNIEQPDRSQLFTVLVSDNPLPKDPVHRFCRRELAA